MSEQTPRINATYLEKFVNQTVRIVGKVTKVQGENAVIDAGGTITLILTRVPTLLSTYLATSTG